MATNYSVTGRVVYPNGAPVVSATVQVYERTGLGADTAKSGGSATTTSSGNFTANWAEGSTRAAPWEVFVRITKDSTTIDSPLIYDLVDTITIHIIFGTTSYTGLSEWERIEARVTPLISPTDPEDVPADRLEWLARRADVFPTHLGLYVQAHRLAADRTVKPRTCYAFFRAGLPVDLPKLLRAGEPAWKRALRNAWKRKILPLPVDLDDEMADEMAAMRELLVEAATTEPSTGRSLWSLLDLTGINQTEKEDFMEAWVNRESLGSFWEAIAEHSTLDTKVGDLQFALQAATLTRNHLPLLDKIQPLYGAGVNAVSDFAAWSYEDWDEFLEGETVAPPAEIEGATTIERRQKYARGLERIVEDSFPTLSLRHRIAADEAGSGGPTDTDELVQFFDDNPGFDITRTNIARWVAENDNVFENATDPVVARAQLERAQRVYRLTPRIGRYATAKVLLNNGISSAADVVTRTRDEFVNEFSGLFPTTHHEAENLARRVWDNASRIHGVAMGMASRFALSKSRVVPNALGGVGDYDLSEGALQDLGGVLQNLDYCACEHCRSVFSPAAYLADLLAFLSERPSKVSEETALDELTDANRRPDLTEILLNCENTNTPLPYIDLVNEALEARFTGTLTAENAKQTSWPAAELLLHPEHIDTEIYAGTSPDPYITSMVYPWVLPFSLANLEAREYLNQAGVPLPDLLLRLGSPVSPPSDAWTAASLGLIELQAEIIAGDYEGNASTDDREFWGFVVGVPDNDWVDVLNGSHETEGDVGEILRRANLKLDDLLELLDLTFIDPLTYEGMGAGAISVSFDESCQLDDARFYNLDANHLGRLHRFIRLQRATQIPPRLLNILIDDVGGGLDQPFLAKLVYIRWLQGRLGTAWDEIATWWAPRIDARKYEDASLYMRAFLLSAHGTAEFNDFAPDGNDWTTLVGESGAPTLTEGHVRTILAACGLTRPEFEAIQDAGLAGSTFTFANLTGYYRVGSFARANKMSVESLIALISLTGISPFTSPATARTFVETLAHIRESRFSQRELDWLLRHPTDLEQEFRNDARVGAALGQLALDLARVNAEVAELIDPAGTEIKANLASIFLPNVTILNEAMAILKLESEEDEATQTAFVNTHFASFTDPAVANANLVTDEGGTIADVAERFNWLQREFVRTKRRESLIIECLALLTSLDRAACRELLFNVLTDPEDVEHTDPLYGVFNGPYATQAEVDAKLTRALQTSLFVAFDRLDSAARVVRGFGIPAAQISWYSNNTAWIDLDAMPLNGTDSDIPFSKWNALREAMALRDLFPSDVNGLREISDASTVTAALNVLATYTGWDVSVETGVGFIADELDWTTAVFDNGLALTWLRGIVDVVEQLGVTVVQVWSWVNTSLESAQIKQATRAKFSEAKWREVARPMRDRIRLAQREALIAAILATDATVATRAQLSDQLLIDVDMAPCMMSSRINQAISAVQTFINRALLGLEANFEFGGEASERWEWMKNYRVWEANRKVFLYPENWIQPGLRRGKTLSFEKLESSLLQGALDEDKLEATLMQYVEHLDEVAKLEIISTYDTSASFDLDGGEMWVLGRTQSPPQRYWVRKRSHGQWLPWEEVPLPIQSDNIVLVVRGSHTYLFWLNRDNAGNANAAPEGNKDFNFDRLTLAWSERRRDGWSDPRMSDSVLIPRLSAANSDGAIPPNTYLLKTINTTPLVQIRAYVVNSDDNAGSLSFQSFLFDTSTKRAQSHALGSTPDAFDELALFEGYAVEGQRYTADTAFDQKLYSVDEAEEVLISGTTFVQGESRVELFRQHKYRYKRAFVHQSDQWLSLGSKKYTPAFFDDHEHKYLIRVEPLGDNAAHQNEGAAPNQPGSINTKGFWGLGGDDQDVPAEVEDPYIKVQLIKDALTPYQPGYLQTPGIQAQLIGLVNYGNFPVQFFPAGNTGMVYGGAADAVGGNDGVLDGDPDLNPEPEAVWLRLMNFHHPFASHLISELNLRGPWGLYAPKQSGLLRQLGQMEPLASGGLDVNLDVVKKPIPVDEFDFEANGSYSIYNWELFFHIPMLIADKLSASQRFADAQRWYHAIFNPLDPIQGEEETASSRYWRVRPLYEAALAGEQNQLQAMLGIGVTADEQEAAVNAFNEQIDAWLDSPFDPHAVARLRPGAYMRATFMKYLDNLIAWADQLFRRDSIETITEATILYKLAAELLGPRPQKLPALGGTAKTFSELAEGLDEFSNAAVALENWVYVSPGSAQLLEGEIQPVGRKKIPVRFWYFCYPPNPKLLGYWDTIEDRLWKIRHCQNIDGVTRQLPLFQPPIDPALLVAAAAAGLDITSALSEAGSGLPPYRFRHVYAKALDFCGELRNLGGALLSAFEKRDGEEIAQIRSAHERVLLDASRDIRVQQIEEAEERIKALQSTAAGIDQRRSYYDRLYDENVSPGEKAQQEWLKIAMYSTLATQGIQALASFLGLIPEFEMGFPIVFSTKYSGSHISSGVRGIAEITSMLTTGANFMASKLGTDAQHLRRREEWGFQRDQADLEKKRVEREILAAQIQLAVAKLELSNHDLRAKQAKEVDEYLRDKYTNTELYSWMADRISEVYFQAYELAFDLAKRAETAYRHELAIDADEARIVQFGYWDSLHDGLMAGERLAKDLRRLEKAYMDRDVRELELRKNVSLARLAPAALSVLQETGSCTFKIPEVLFNLDHPGHVLRRIRSVSVTIPAVVGPYTSLGARLKLDAHKIRKTAADELVSVYGGHDMIATSTAVNDSGLFQLDFRDERYLPFEYAGAADSEWTLDLPTTVRQFDYRSISDVVITLAYTARDGGDGYRGTVQSELETKFNEAFTNASQLIVVHDMFPNEWEAFLSPAATAEFQTLSIPLTKQHFPYFVQRAGFQINSVDFVLLLAEGTAAGGTMATTFQSSGLTLTQVGNTMTGQRIFSPAVQPATWTLTRAEGGSPSGLVLETDDWLDRNLVIGLLLVVNYTLT